ncbi:acyl carrier protein [Streptomyces scopuliridis]|uniref:acyl carrier protein n=1 Tax=Streptomyces scopuliridis TaxID=452529 RepID=UPI0036BD1F23
MSRNVVTPSSDEILSRVRVIVAEELELEESPGDIDPAARFVEDFDADSLALIQILARIDKELTISVPVEEAENLIDLRTLADHVIARAAGTDHA